MLRTHTHTPLYVTFLGVLLALSTVSAQYYPPVTTSQSSFGPGSVVETTNTSSESAQSGASFGGTKTVTTTTTTSTNSDGEKVESTCIELKSESIGFGSTDTATGGGVTALQDFLIFKGLMDGSPTGYFGFKTYKAVLTYQKTKGVDQVGRVGPLTKKLIKEDSCKAVISASAVSPLGSVVTTTSQAASGGTATMSANTSGCSFGTCTSSNGSSFPYFFTHQVTASGSYLSKVIMTLRGGSSTLLGSSLRACTKPVGSSGCDSDNSFIRVKDQPGWVYDSKTDTFSINRDVSQEKLPNVEYVSIIKTFSNQTYEIKWKAVASSQQQKTSSVTSGQTSSAVFGAGASGVPGSAPVTYSWVGYAGPILGQQSPTNLGFSEPSTPCTQSNVGATYYLGKSSSGTDVVATCTASNQSVTGSASVSDTTLNTTTGSNSQASFGGSGTVTNTTNSSATKSQASFGPSYSYVSGTFKSGDQTIEWSCGNAGAPAPEGSGWVAQESGCYHRVAQ